MHKQRDEYTAAREIVDLYYDAPDNASTVESLSCLCFSLARVFEISDKRIIWDDMFDYFDQDYTAMREGLQRPEKSVIKKIHDRIIITLEQSKYPVNNTET